MRGHLALLALLVRGNEENLYLGKLSAEFCAKECSQRGFCCNDFFVGSNQYLSCAQACMMRVRRMPKMECSKKCFEGRKCRYTSRGFLYQTCGTCADANNTAACAHGVRNETACLAGCALFDETESTDSRIVYATEELRAELRRVLTRDAPGSCLNFRFFYTHQIEHLVDLLRVDSTRVEGEHIKRTLLRRLYKRFGVSHCLKNLNKFSVNILHQLAYMWLDRRERTSDSLPWLHQALAAVLRADPTTSLLNLELFSAKDRVLLAESVRRMFQESENLIVNADNVINRLKEKYGYLSFDGNEFTVHEDDLSSFDTTTLLLMYDLIGEDEPMPIEECPWAKGIVTDQPNVLKCRNGVYCNYTSEWGLGYSCCTEHGGRHLCPINLPVMCSDSQCAISADYCCARNDTICHDRGGGVHDSVGSVCEEGCACGGIWDPVCSKRTTYSSECQARCAGVSHFTHGACDCMCPETWDPVCASNGGTYQNKCRANCIGIDFTFGACSAAPQTCTANSVEIECVYDGCKGTCDEDGHCVQGTPDKRCEEGGLPADDRGWCRGGRRESWCPAKRISKEVHETLAVADGQNEHFALTVFGCPRVTDREAQWHSVQRRYGARCCIDQSEEPSATAAPICVSAFCMKTGGCECDHIWDGSKSCDHDCDSCGKYWYTYTEALERCHDISVHVGASFHLCTRDEVLADLCCETGCQLDHTRVWVLPERIDTFDVPVHWFSDGGSKNYDWMRDRCRAKSMRLCSYDELCRSKGAYPAKWPGIRHDAWAPIEDEKFGGRRWVQVGDAGKICTLETCSECCGDWCSDKEDYPWKGNYVCCEDEATPERVQQQVKKPGHPLATVKATAAGKVPQNDSPRKPREAGHMAPILKHVSKKAANSPAYVPRICVVRVDEGEWGRVKATRYENTSWGIIHRSDPECQSNCYSVAIREGKYDFPTIRECPHGCDSVNGECVVLITMIERAPDPIVGTRLLADLKKQGFSPSVPHYKVDSCRIKNATDGGQPVELQEISALTEELNKCSLAMYLNKASTFFFHIGYEAIAERCMESLPAETIGPLCKFELYEQHMFEECAWSEDYCAAHCFDRVRNDGVCDAECGDKDEDCAVPATSVWKSCAEIGEICFCYSEIRFSTTTFSEQRLQIKTNGSTIPTACLESVFGDPQVGASKKCYCHVNVTDRAAAFTPPPVDHTAPVIVKPFDVLFFVTMVFSNNSDTNLKLLTRDVLDEWQEIMHVYLPKNHVEVNEVAGKSPYGGEIGLRFPVSVVVSMHFATKREAVRVTELLRLDDVRRAIQDHWNGREDGVDVSLDEVFVSVEYDGHVVCGDGATAFSCLDCPKCAGDCMWSTGLCIERSVSCGLSRRPTCALCLPTHESDPLLLPPNPNAVCAGDCRWVEGACVDRIFDCGGGHTAKSCALCAASCDVECVRSEAGCIERKVFCGSGQYATTCARCLAMESSADHAVAVVRCSGDCQLDGSICVGRRFDCGLGSTASSCSTCPAASCDGECLWSTTGLGCIERTVFCGNNHYATVCKRCLVGSSQCAGDCRLKGAACVERTADCGHGNWATTCAACPATSCEGECMWTTAGLCVEKTVHCGNSFYATTCAKCVVDAKAKKACGGECQWNVDACEAKKVDCEKNDCPHQWNFCSNEGEICDCATVISYGLPGRQPHAKVNVTGRNFPTLCNKYLSATPEKNTKHCYCKKDASLPVPEQSALWEILAHTEAAIEHGEKSGKFDQMILDSLRTSLPHFPTEDISISSHNITNRALHQYIFLFLVDARDKDHFESLLESELFATRVNQLLKKQTAPLNIAVVLAVKKVDERVRPPLYGTCGNPSGQRVPVSFDCSGTTYATDILASCGCSNAPPCSEELCCTKPLATVAMHEGLRKESPLALTTIGCPEEYRKVEPQWHLTERRHGVRCCATQDQNVTCRTAFCPDDGTENCCNMFACTRDCQACGKYWYTYEEALQRCADMSVATGIDYRMCTLREVQQNHCCDAGCQYDSNRIWVLATAEGKPKQGGKHRYGGSILLQELMSSDAFLPSVIEYQATLNCSWPSNYIPGGRLDACARGARKQNFSTFHFDHSIGSTVKPPMYGSDAACSWTDTKKKATVCSFTFSREFELDYCRDTCMHCAPRCTGRLRGDRICDPECVGPTCDDSGDCSELEGGAWNWAFCADEKGLCTCSTEIRFSVSEYSEPHTSTSVHGRSYPTACEATTLGELKASGKRKCFCREGYAPKPAAPTTPQAFLAAKGQSCDEACDAQQRMCDREELEKAARTLSTCKTAIVRLGKSPKKGGPRATGSSGCTYTPGEAGWYHVEKQRGVPISCAEKSAANSQRVCHCKSSVPAHAEITIGIAGTKADLTATEVLGSIMKSFPRDRVVVRKSRNQNANLTSYTAQFRLDSEWEAAHMQKTWQTPVARENLTRILRESGVSSGDAEILDTRIVDPNAATETKVELDGERKKRADKQALTEEEVDSEKDVPFEERMQGDAPDPSIDGPVAPKKKTDAESQVESDLTAPPAPYHEVDISVEMKLYVDKSTAVITLERDQQWQLSLRINEAIRELLEFHHDGLDLQCSFDGQFAMVAALCSLGVHHITYAEDIASTLNTAEFAQQMLERLRPLQAALFTVSRVAVARVTIDSMTPHFAAVGPVRCPTSNLVILGSCTVEDPVGEVCNTTVTPHSAHCTNIWARPLCVYCEHSCPQLAQDAFVTSAQSASCVCGRTYGWVDGWKDAVYVKDGCAATFVCRDANVVCVDDGTARKECKCKESIMVEISLWVEFEDVPNLNLRLVLTDAVASPALAGDLPSDRLHVSATSLRAPTKTRQTFVRYVVPFAARPKAEALTATASTTAFSSSMKESLARFLGATQVVMMRGVRMILNDYGYEFTGKIDFFADRKLAPSRKEEKQLQDALSFSIGNYSHRADFSVKILHIGTHHTILKDPIGRRLLENGSFPLCVDFELSRFGAEKSAHAVADTICERPFKDILKEQVGSQFGVTVTGLELTHDMGTAQCVDAWIPVVGTLELRVKSEPDQNKLQDALGAISGALSTIFVKSPWFLRRVARLLDVYHKNAEGITVKDTYVMYTKTQEHAADILALIESNDFHDNMVRNMQSGGLSVNSFTLANWRIATTFPHPLDSSFTTSIRFNVFLPSAEEVAPIDELSEAATFAAISQFGVPKDRVEVFIFEVLDNLDAKHFVGIHYTLSDMTNDTSTALLDKQFNFDQKLKRSFNDFLGSAFAFKTNAVFLPVEGEVHMHRQSVAQFVLCRLCASFLRHMSIPDGFVHTAAKFAISSVLSDLPLRSFKVFVHRQEAFGRTILSISIVVVDADSHAQARKWEDSFLQADLPAALPHVLAKWLQVSYKVKIDLIDIAILNVPYDDAVDAHTCPSSPAARNETAPDGTVLEEGTEEQETTEGSMTLEVLESNAAKAHNIDAVAKTAIAESLNVEEHRVNARVSRRRLSEGRQLSASASNVKYDVEFEVVMDSTEDARILASVMNDDDFVKVLKDVVSQKMPDTHEVQEIADLSSSNKMVNTMVVL